MDDVIRCPQCDTDEVGEVVLMEEVRALEQGGKVIARDFLEFGSPRYICSDGHEFDELAPIAPTQPTA